MQARYEEIVDVSNIATFPTADATLDALNVSPSIRTALPQKHELSRIISLAQKENFKSATDVSKKVLLLCIDMQNDFMEDIGSLPVSGSKGDVERLTRFIYNNMHAVSRIMCSLDTHSAAQIFHPCWWEDGKGNQPVPFTEITNAEVAAGKWRSVFGEVSKSNDYLENLEKSGKKKLMIWPYHCLQGTTGANLERQFTNMLYFHSVARKTRPAFIPKGYDAFSEMYGIIRPEWSASNFLNTPVLNAIKEYDMVLVAGEAKSHCVMESFSQILEYYAGQLDITQRIFFLEDCTSPIKGCEDMANNAFEGFRRQYGINIVKSTDLQL